MLLGRHFSDIAQLSFSRLQVNYTHLEAWLSDMPFTHTEVPDAPRKTFRFEYTFPVTYSVQIPTLRAALSTDFTFMFDVELSQQSQEHMAFFKLEPEAAQNLEWNCNRITEIQYLLTLLVGAPVYPEHVVLYQHDDGSAREQAARHTHLLFP